MVAKVISMLLKSMLTKVHGQHESLGTGAWTVCNLEWSRGNGGKTLLCGDGPRWLHSLWAIQLVPFLGFMFTKPPDHVLDYMEISLQGQMYSSENFAIFCKTFLTILYTSGPYDFDLYKSFPSGSSLGH